jgi:hypothetical protein
MTQLKYLAIATLIFGGCTQEAEVSPEGAQLINLDPVEGTPGGTAAQHQDCTASDACFEGLTCLTSVGPLNQKISTCEIPCDRGCPDGQTCVSDDRFGAICWQVDADGRVVADEQLPRQGEPCPNRVCDRDLTCVAYYGIAGPRGPLFTSCEIRCSDNSECPSAQRCVTIADGPGQVCRPGDR